MTIFQSKSEENEFVASLALQNEKYNACVSRLYYSTLCLIQHVVIQDLKISEEDIKSNTKGSGSHNWLFNEVGKYARKTSWSDYHKFNEDLNDLKAYRVKADYHNLNITESEKDEAYNIDARIKSSLKRYFNSL